jgi:RNA polymerase sigma-70 factor (ECF subfamily)
MTSRDVVALYDTHARKLIGYFMRRTGDPDLALELTGEVFLTAYEQRARCHGAAEGQRAAWLYQIAASRLADHFRRKAKDERTAQILEKLRAPTAREAETMALLAESSELDEPMAAAFDGLSEEQQQAIRMHVIEEQPYAELSTTLGVSEDAARARVSRGLRALRKAVVPARGSQR